MQPSTTRLQPSHLALDPTVADALERPRARVAGPAARALVLALVTAGATIRCATPASCSELQSCPSDAAVLATDAGPTGAPSATLSASDAGDSLVPPSPESSSPTLVPVPPAGPLDDGPPSLDAGAVAELTPEPDAAPGSSDAGWLEVNDSGVMAELDAGTSDAGADTCAQGGCRADEPTCRELGNCECQPFEVRSCAVAGALGACAQGTQRCTDEGRFSDCSISPEPFDSCTAGADENCDGVANSPLDPECQCVAGSAMCLDQVPNNQRRVCSTIGRWRAPEQCQFACIGAGECAGECTPGKRKCEGNEHFECDTSGQWQSLGACEASTPCQGAGQCVQCPGGSYAEDGACVFFSECAPGEFAADPGSSTTDRRCAACPEGTFSDVANATECTPWTTCPAGQFVAVEGTATTDRECAPCGVGTFSSVANAASCTVCTPGTFSAEPGAASCAALTTCPAGTYATTLGSAKGDRVCSVCESGSFSTQANVSACTPYTPCNPGYTEATPGTTTSDHTCKPIPSCAGLSVECGEDIDENCCTNLPVTGGQFELMNDESLPSTISSFRLDKFEVTVGRFRKFATAWKNGYRPAAGAGRHTHLNGGQGLINADSSSTYELGWDPSWEDKVNVADSARMADIDRSTWTPTAQKNERLPVNYVNWFEAYAFCVWDGGFLPSGAEWSYASTGGSQQRYYPWSSPATSTTIDSTYAAYDCGGTSTCTVADFAEVGHHVKGEGFFGQADLGGNVEEWVLDEYPANAACTDCAYLPETFTLRVARGGAFNDAALALENRRLNMFSPETRSDRAGFRCARAE